MRRGYGMPIPRNTYPAGIPYYGIFFFTYDLGPVMPRCVGKSSSPPIPPLPWQLLQHLIYCYTSVLPHSDTSISITSEHPLPSNVYTHEYTYYIPVLICLLSTTLRVLFVPTSFLLELLLPGNGFGFLLFYYHSDFF